MTLADLLASRLTKRTSGLRRLKFDAVRSGKGAHLEVQPMIAYAIAADTVVLSDSVDELKSLESRRLTRPSLCLKITNTGRAPTTVEEIGLTGRFEEPRLGMREPLLHDSARWPRELNPGESVVAYFSAALSQHPVLGAMRRAYVRTTDDHTWSGSNRALGYFIKDTVRARSQGRKTAAE